MVVLISAYSQIDSHRHGAVRPRQYRLPWLHGHRDIGFCADRDEEHLER